MNLFISTASQNLIIILFENNKIVKSINQSGSNNHSEVMMPLIVDILKDVTISKIYVVNGPGSYTGLRVAMTFAKTYAYTKNISLYTINYLEAIYHTYDTPVAIDAKGKKYFRYDGKTLVLTDDITNCLVDKELDVEILLAKKYFDKLIEVPAKEASINYVKSAI